MVLAGYSRERQGKGKTGGQVSSQSDLPAEELVKVAEGLNVTVLDSVVPYATEAELTAEASYRKTFEKEQQTKLEHGVPENSVFAIGDEITPYLTTLVPREDGSYTYSTDYFTAANEGYSLQGGANDGSSFPVYFDAMTYTEGTRRLKHSLFRPLAAGEELEYTLIYIIDEDQLDNMFLWFYSWNTVVNPDGTWNIMPYVKISE